MMWWEEHSAMAEDYKDLEWLVYHFDRLDLNDLKEDEFDNATGPLSEQIWAIREGLA